MTDHEMKQAITSWVKEKPARRIKLLKQWRNNLKDDFIDGVFDPIGETPTVGDRALPYEGTDIGTIESISSTNKCIVAFHGCDLPNLIVYTDDFVRNLAENRWDFLKQKTKTV